MRQIIAGALLCAFMLESSGAAIAAPSASIPITGMRAEFTADLASAAFALQSHLESPYLLALVTNSAQLYAAIHAPAPTFPKSKNVSRRTHPRLARVRGESTGSGLQGRLPNMVTLRSHPFDFSHPPKDPLAMKDQSVSKAAPASSPSSIAAGSSQPSVAAAPAAASPQRRRQ